MNASAPHVGRLRRPAVCFDWHLRDGWTNLHYVGKLRHAALFLSAALCSSELARAQQAPNAVPIGPVPASTPHSAAVEPYAPIPPPPKSSKDRAAREQDRIAISFGIYWFQLLGGAYGAVIGAYVTPDTLLEVDGYRAVSLVPGQHSDTVGVAVRQFLAETLYLRLGARYRWLQTHRVLNFDDHEERLVQVDIGADVTAGARWQRQRLMFGVDFLGLYLPLGAFFSEEQVVDESNGELLAAEPVGLSRRPDLRIAQLYIGVSF